MDAIDTCVTGAIPQISDARAGIKLLDFKPFNPVDKRTEITYTVDSTGEMKRATKGMTGIIIELCSRNKTAEVEDQLEKDVEEFAARGLRALAVAIEDVPSGNKDEPGNGFELVGLLAIFDPPRDDTKQTIDEAQALGVKVKMVTGDQLAIAKETGRRLGLGDHMYPAKVLQAGGFPEGGKHLNLDEMILDADGFAGVFPEHKYEIVKRLQALGHLCAMTGDGANDARASCSLSLLELSLVDPSLTLLPRSQPLSRAPTSVSPSRVPPTLLAAPPTSSSPSRVCRPSSTPSASRASSSSACATTRSTPAPSRSVSVRPSPRRLCSELERPSADLVVLAPAVIGFAVMAFAFQFDFPPFMVLIIALLNDGTIMTLSLDRVLPSATPDSWDLGEIFTFAFAYGLYLAAGTIAFYCVIIYTTFFSDKFGVSNITEPNDFELHMIIYLQSVLLPLPLVRTSPCTDALSLSSSLAGSPRSRRPSSSSPGRTASSSWSAPRSPSSWRSASPSSSRRSSPPTATGASPRSAASRAAGSASSGCVLPSPPLSPPRRSRPGLTLLLFLSLSLSLQIWNIVWFFPLDFVKFGVRALVRMYNTRRGKHAQGCKPVDGVPITRTQSRHESRISSRDVKLRRAGRV